MAKKILLRASDVAEMLDVSISKAYKIIHEANEKLEKMNKLTIRGRIPYEYLNDILYFSESKVNKEMSEMATAKKNPITNKWDIQIRYKDSFGNNKKTTRRGFDTKKEAERAAYDFIKKQEKDFNMLFSDFIDIYMDDMKGRLKENTVRTKNYIINLKILPYFAKFKVSEITPAKVRSWQNDMIAKGYKDTYLKTINNQLSAIFNFAVQLYGISENPVKKAGGMGKSYSEEMKFWTKDEFVRFLEKIMNKPTSYIIFKVFYWTGMRLGELLALTPSDLHLNQKYISINKSYQRIGGRDVITDPKTPKSKRNITIPDFLVEDLREYLDMLYSPDPNERVFRVTKSFLEKEMRRGAKEAGLERIRIHDLRHSHAALLIEMGFPILAVSNRLGHEKIQTTLQVYGHLYPNKQQMIADKLNERFGKEQ